MFRSKKMGKRFEARHGQHVEDGAIMTAISLASEVTNSCRRIDVSTLEKKENETVCLWLLD